MLQVRLRAKPCCCMDPGPNCGKQCGTPPLMGLEPSNFASGLARRGGKTFQRVVKRLERWQ